MSFRGSQAEIYSGARCPTCTGAVVHVPYAGGVATEQSALPVEAHLTLPDGATHRGIVILLVDSDGEVQAVHATSIGEGDFAAS